MASSIETTSTTTTLKNNGTAYISVDTNENVTLAHPLALAQGGSGAVSVNGIVQVVNTQVSAVASGTTTMPQDDTIPQNTEGNEYMTLAITPKHASNKLRIDIVSVDENNSAGNPTTYALFQDSTAGALAAWGNTHDNINWLYTTNLTHYMTAGTTSATTFKLRIGGHSASTTTFNGKTTGRLFGGVCASSITITEYSV
tara:strand:- start:1221 stop:1817 length:597 start_codon:yes stop_codon:yes gene_type:complete